MAEISVTTFAEARECYRNKNLRQALYDAGEVIMSDVVVNLHGDEHRDRRRLGEPALPPGHLHAL